MLSRQYFYKVSSWHGQINILVYETPDHSVLCYKREKTSLKRVITSMYYDQFLTGYL